MDTRDPTPAPATTSSGAPDYRGELVGGRYLLGPLIGRGGTASVHAGVDQRLRRRVAVKVIHPEHARSDAQRRRARREAVVGASFDHPHVVPLLDHGDELLAHGEHRPYLVMPLLEGATLRGLVLEGSIAWPRAVALCRQLLAGLAAIHACGVIHRDLKACNAFISHEQGREHLRILDFGLARVTREGLLSRWPASASGVIVGTPAYLAPEQIRGRPIDERVDLYAAGVILFEALTRRLPFGGSEYEVLTAHVGEPPPSPRAIAGADAIPASVEASVLRALAKDPAARFASAAEFDAALAQALREAGISTPVNACPEGHAGTTEAQASLAAWTSFDYARAHASACEAGRINRAWGPLQVLMSLIPEV
ncbi:MAG: serine/threonine-protein kinase [Nannocystaceae bacterium]